MKKITKIEIPEELNVTKLEKLVVMNTMLAEIVIKEVSEMRNLAEKRRQYLAEEKVEIKDSRRRTGISLVIITCLAIAYSCGLGYFGKL